VIPLAWMTSIKAKLGVVVLGSVVAGLAGGAFLLLQDVRMRYSLLVAVVISVLAIQVLARGMTAPLREMAAVSRRMAAGDHTARVSAGSTRGRDEVGQLAADFNTMAAELERVDAQRRRLVADASHELRTPITALRALLENLADGVTRPDPDALAVALAQTERLGRLVEQLLDLSRLEAGEVPLHRSPVVVAELCERAAAEARSHCASLGRQVHVVVDVERVEVGADPERLAQVLANLLDNATRHAPAGGTVRLLAHRPPHGTGPGVRIEVVDDGPGIVAADRERVFDRFARADDARARTARATRETGGTGLGLAIVRWVVELHGGTVRIGDPPGSAVHGPGAGCRVVVDLPA